MRRLPLVLLLLAGSASAQVTPTQGSLIIAGEQRELPLMHTDVRAEVHGFVQRVTVVQSFHNPTAEAIEAVYVFPLPTDAAVGAMTIHVGARTLRATIKTREQAREVYAAAKRTGRRAALLEQERPNIFTQSVTGILPGEKIDVEISYDAQVTYQDGHYELAFPMVVGPRYNPVTVADAGRISPPLLPPGSRAGSDITLAVELHPGAPVRKVWSVSHRILDREDGVRSVSLAPDESIPNKDFVLRWEMADDKPVAALAAEAGPRTGTFALLLDPPRAPAPALIAPRELIFVVDTSGSMEGEPLSRVKAAMRIALHKLQPTDSFNIINFSSTAGQFSRSPVVASADNVRRGLSWLNGLSGGGGTEMLTGVRAALDGAATTRLRVVCFMTDGYIGNEAEVAAEVRRLLGNARLFSFGVGSSVNRLLLEWLAEAGRGSAQFIQLAEPAEPQIDAFYARIAAPLLTDVTIDWGTAQVSDQVPAVLPDLWSGQPLRVTGHVQASGPVAIRVGAKLAGKQIWYPLTLNLAVTGGEAPVGPLARIWARQQIGELERPRLGQVPVPYQARITQLALEHRLVSAYTSFVAVEDKVVVEGGTTRTIQVPVEVPEGVAYRNVARGGGGGGDYGGSGPDATSSGGGGGGMSPADAPPPTVTSGSSGGGDQGASEDDESPNEARAPEPTMESPTRADRFEWTGGLARRWHLGVGVGAGTLQAADFDTAATSAFHLRVSRDVARLMAIGIDATLLRAGADYTSVQGLGTVLLGLSSRLRVLLGLGLGRPDGHNELAAMFGAEYLVHVGPLHMGLQARADLTTPSGDGQDLRAFTAGLHFEW